MSEPITLESLQASQVRETMHFDGPRGPGGFFGYWYQGVQFPRLQRKVTYWRSSKGHTIEWFVDGVKVGEKLSDAVPALNQALVLTDEEAAALALFTDEWADLRAAVPYPLSRALRDKGLIEAERGKSRLRRGGRQ